MRYLLLLNFILLITACNGQNDRQSDSDDVRELNGFEIKDPTVPKDEIYIGTPKRDAIPAIDDPDYVKGKMQNLCPPEIK